MKKYSILITLALICINTIAQTQNKDDDKKWDVSNPKGTTKDIEFTTTESA